MRGVRNQSLNVIPKHFKMNTVQRENISRSQGEKKIKYHKNVSDVTKEDLFLIQ